MKKILILLLLIGFNGSIYGQSKRELEPDVIPPPPKLVIKFNLSLLLEPKARNYELSFEHFLNNRFSLQHRAAYVRDNPLDRAASTLACRCEGFRIGTGSRFYLREANRKDIGYLGLNVSYEYFFGNKRALINHGEGTFFQHKEFAFRQNIIGGHLTFGTLSFLSDNFALDAGIALGLRYFENVYDDEGVPASATYELQDDNKLEAFYTDEPGNHVKPSFQILFKLAYVIK